MFGEAQLRHTDVVIAGGGLAGSLAAAMLGRAGIDAILVDLHPVYPPDFRCEKLDSAQVKTLRLTGLADAVIAASTPDQTCWVARHGRLVEKLPGERQRGILYDTLVNTVRSQLPNRTEFVHAKVTDIATGAERQTVRLSTGEEIAARLVVLATGLNIGNTVGPLTFGWMMDHGAPRSVFLGSVFFMALTAVYGLFEERRGASRNPFPHVRGES